MKRGDPAAGSGSNEVFGAAVRQVLGGLNYREEAARIGLHFTTLYDMARGLPKSMETVIRFARATGQDVNTWLEMAGYEPIETGGDLLTAGLRALNEEFGRPIPVDFSAWDGSR